MSEEAYDARDGTYRKYCQARLAEDPGWTLEKELAARRGVSATRLDATGRGHGRGVVATEWWRVPGTRNGRKEGATHQGEGEWCTGLGPEWRRVPTKSRGRRPEGCQQHPWGWVGGVRFCFWPDWRMSRMSLHQVTLALANRCPMRQQSGRRG